MTRIRSRAFSKRTLRGLALALIAMLYVPGCATSDVREERREEQESLILSQTKQKGWVDLDATQSAKDRNQKIRQAIASVRDSASHYYKKLIERDQRRREEIAAKAAFKEPSETPKKTESKIVKPQVAAVSLAEDFAFQFKNAPLEEVIYLVGGELGLNILVPIAVPETVTASFPAVDARKGLDSILARYGYALREQDKILVLEKVPSDPLITKTFRLKTGVGIDISKQIEPLISENGVVTAEPEQRALVVTAVQADLDKVASYLAILDRRPRQVLIEALIVEVSRKNNFKMGIDLEYGGFQAGSTDFDFSSNFSPIPTATSPNPFSFGVSNAKNLVEFMLSADQGISRLHVLHSPFISAQSGKKADLRVIQRIPYIEATTSIGAAEGSSSGTVTSAEEIQFAETGVTLMVTPRIGEDDIVEIAVKPKVDELVGFLVGVPVIDTREAETTIMVRNQQTVVIGGILRNSHTFSESKIPVLGDIPILGELFKKTEETDEKVELMIFLTPHILGYGLEDYQGYRPQDAMLGADKPFNNLHRVLNRENREMMRVK